jgi:sulfatase modifying factor 1
VKPQNAVFFAAFCAVSFLSLAPSQAVPVTMQTVHVGNPGNTNDSNNGSVYGGVPYAYNIGTYDVTLNQYTAFLNAVAKSDSNNLYNPSMATDLHSAGISRSGGSGNYTYSIIGSGQRPVTYVSWYDAARFCNWLTNGQGSGGTETGVYTLTGPTSISGTLPATHSGLVASGTPKWFIPTESEWYKAAYYNVAGSSYYWFPFGSSNIPEENNPTALSNNSGNFYSTLTGYAVTQSLTAYDPNQNYLTDVGTYSNSISPYGSYDMGGDVNQWNETLNGSARRVRGGYWSGFASSLASYSGNQYAPNNEFNNLGFRVAELPEPSSIALFALGTIGVVVTARRRKVISLR